MTKFTKGNWFYSKHTPYGDGVCFNIQSDIPTNETFIGEVGGGLQDNEQIEANAKLIAASKDLFESLQGLVAIHSQVISVMTAGRIPGWQKIDDTFNKAHEAIKKATA